jgi:hypothetical protein
VRTYDVDGLHFDDYFYPYPKGKEVFPDEASFAKYQASGGTLEKDAWRRSNIDGFVQRVYDQTKRVRKSVRVSASPFGIWRPGNPKGVQGMDAFSAISADSRKWLCEGWVDVVIPQLYWKIEAPKQPYAELLNWWLSQNQRGRLVVVGNYASRINSSAESWQPGEIVNQIVRTREARGDGNVHFSAVALMQNRKGLSEMKRGVYAEAAIVPETEWLQSGARALTAQVEAQADDERVDVKWESSGRARAWVMQERRDGRWRTSVLGGGANSAELAREDGFGRLEEVAVSVMDAEARLSRPVRIRVQRTVEQAAARDGARPTARAVGTPIAMMYPEDGAGGMSDRRRGE